MNKRKLIITAIIVILIDLISKSLVTNLMNEYESIQIIPHFFKITYAKNIGVAFSMLEGNRPLIIIATILIISIIVNYISNKTLNFKEQLSIGLILGGAIGNLIDRIIYGYVIDFLDFKIINYNYPIFNIADSAIVVGVIIYLIINIKHESSDNNENKSKLSRKNR